MSIPTPKSADAATAGEVSPMDRLQAAYDQSQAVSELVTALHLIAQQECASSSREDRAMYGLAEQAEKLAEHIADELDAVLADLRYEQEAAA